MRLLYVLTVFTALLSGCSASYTLISANREATTVGKVTVQPTSAWNRAPSTAHDTQWEETWTRNGPMLDSLTFVGALPSGKSLVRQAKNSDKQVPAFQANMSPQDIASMLESQLKFGGGAVLFEIKSISPTTYLNQQALSIVYEYRGRNEVPMRGHTVACIIGEKLYMIGLNATAIHYYGALEGEFQQLRDSAALK